MDVNYFTEICFIFGAIVAMIKAGVFTLPDSKSCMGIGMYMFGLYS